MATTITYNAKGHTVTVVSVKGSAWGTVVIDDTKTLSLTADPAGGFERTLYAFLGTAVSGPTKSTTSIANDTVTAVFATNGVNPLTGLGASRFFDAYSGETVQIQLAEAAIFGDGTLTSDAVAAATSVTNNSTAGKPIPIGQWVSPPLDDAITSDTLTIDVFVGAGHVVDQVEVTFTDSAAAAHSALATRIVREPQYEMIPDDAEFAGLRAKYGTTPGAFEMWRAVISITTAAEGAGSVAFVATSENGSTFNSATEGMFALRRYIDRDASEPTLDMWVDSRESLPVSGTFTARDGDIVTGGTSGAIGVVDGFGTVDNEFVNTATINIVRLNVTATDFSTSETLSGTTSGTATVTGAQTWIAPTLLGTINDSAAAARDLARACSTIRTTRNTAISESSVCGARIFVRGNYTQVLHTANDFSAGTVNTPTHRTTVQRVGGGRFSIVNFARQSSSTSRSLPTSLYYIECDLRPISPESGARALFGTNSSLITFWQFEDSEWHQPGSGQYGSFGASGFGNDRASHLYLLGFKTSRSTFGVVTGAQLGAYRTILDTAFRNPGEADLNYFQGANDAPGTVTEGNSLMHFFSDGVEGAAAGVHGDTIQGVNAVKNLCILAIVPQNRYQGIFFNEHDPTNANMFVRNIYIRTLHELVDDGDIGSSVVSFNTSARNVVIENSVLASPTSQNNSITSIPSAAPCESWFIRNSVFKDVSGGGGTYAVNAVVRSACVVNCHYYGGDGTAPGIRCTHGTDLTALFVYPWANGGAVADYDIQAVDWRPKAGGPLVSRLVADDITNGSRYLTGEALVVGGPIGAFAAAPTAPTPKTSAFLPFFLIRHKTRRR